MSRCFPYPPPGYVCNRATGDALIESIKIEKEKEKIKQERKEQKRREKELKKKEKKEKKKKEKERLKSIQNTDGTHKRKRDSDGFDDSVKRNGQVNSKEVYLQKTNEPEAEQLERSSLTEEYGQPIISESLCYSSDGTQSKTKKGRIDQSSSNGNCTTQGKVIKFRLKRREPESALSADDIPSTSGRTDNPATKIFDALPVNDSKGVIPRPDEQFAPNAPSVKEDSCILPTRSSPSTKVSKPKSAYEALFREWVPLIHFDAMEIGIDYENWLLPTEKQAEQDRSSLKACDGLSGQQNLSFWPKAHLLPEMDLYALPYTVPF